MKNKIIACIIPLTAAVTVYAAEPDITVASAKKQSPLHKKNQVLPPLVSERIEFYEVNGCRKEDLQCDMRKKAILWKDGNKYDSVTSWSIKWDYDYNRSDKFCAPGSFRATVDILYRYPKWTQQDNVSSTLAYEWERYMQNLAAHEQGHRDIAVNAADELTRAVAALPLFPTCADLDLEVRKLWRAAMEKLNIEQKEYDSRTDHGTAQGALFR